MTTELTITIQEEQRQLMLLALAICALERPGFDMALSEIAALMDNRTEDGRAEMYEGFKRLNADRYHAAELGGGLTRSITFGAAWDKRSEGCGVKGVDIYFVLRGPEGAVELRVLTGWFLPEVHNWHQEVHKAHPGIGCSQGWTLAPLAFHSLKKREGEGWEPANSPCLILNAPCWCSGSSFLAGDPIWEAMLREGGEGFWKKMEEAYRGAFRREGDSGGTVGGDDKPTAF